MRIWVNPHYDRHESSRRAGGENLMRHLTASCLAIGILAIGAGCGAPRSIFEPYRRDVATHIEREPHPGEVKVTFLGTTTLLFDDGETQLMIDGFFSRPPMAKVALSPIETDRA